MRQVAIVTDTTACVPPEQVSRYDIEVVPVPLIINNKTYRDSVDITPTVFYKMLREVKRLPTTSASSPTPYVEAFCNAGRKAPYVLCLTEPSRFSAMYNSARTAMETAKNKLGDVVVDVLECTTAAAGQGLVTLAAARAAAAGNSLEEVKKIVQKLMARVNLFVTLDTLYYLARSGRVPQITAVVDSVLSIKPIFTLNHSKPHLVSLSRSIKGALDRFVLLIEKSTHQGNKLHIAVMHADALKQATVLKEKITSRFDCPEIYITEFTPVMGVHTGPGLVGVAFYEE